MLRTSLRDKTQPRTEDELELVDGATEVIEAATAEAAIAEVHERLGPDARILEAQRDLRGGIGGFFAKEVVRLHAAPGELRGPTTDDRTAAGTPPAQPGASGDGPVASPVERLLDGAPDTVDFATFLRERMASDPDLRIETTDDDAEVAPNDHPVADTADPSVADADAHVGSFEDAAVAAWRAAARRPPAPPVAPDTSVPTGPAAVAQVAEPAPPTPTAATIPGPAWSRERLLHLGVPAELVRGLDLAEGADDLTWTMALARELADACGPLPGGPALLVGPLADDLKSEDLRGEVDEPTARSQVWFDALRDGRWLHLVVGGEGWRDHLPSGPLVVSWSRPQDLPDALRCALELGLTLGYGPLGGEIRRARPLDVALGIRTLVDGR